ncbi:YncE family protein [Belliella marina]|uniref:YncE family protein n=1 Tax=Belliella marina TaxID=1644146 RepID=A0ABW4VT52_9BACT
MKKYMKTVYYPILLLAILTSSCRDDEGINPVDVDELPEQESLIVKGLYLLNEGNMNMNKASLDYYDYESGTYSRNIYEAANPTATLGLGDVGNDIGIYGSKMYAVINASNKVEVMNVSDAKRVAVLDVKNCRYVTFDGAYAYVSAYDGETSLGVDKPNGFVAKFDTVNFEMISKVEVGRQPEEMAVSNGKLYVANSGGYSPPDYENMLSVIDLGSFKVIKEIEVAINLSRVKADGHGNIYVSSRGDYFENPSSLFVVNTITDQVTNHFELACSNLTISGDTAYVIGSEFSYVTGDWDINYSMINTQTKEVLTDPFVSQDLIDKIKTPYGVAVDPMSGYVYITDVGDYVSPGRLYAYDPKTKSTLFEQVTGDIPAHFAFVYKPKIGQ